MSPRAAWRLEALGFSQVLDYAAGKVDWGAAGLRYEGSLAGRPTAGAAADVAVPTCSPAEDLATVQARVRASDFETCIVVNDQRIVLGRLGRRALGAGAGLSVAEAMTDGPRTVRPSLLLADLVTQMVDGGRTTSLVTTLDGRLVGLVRRDAAERMIDSR